MLFFFAIFVIFRSNSFLVVASAALGSLWQNDFVVSPVLHNLSRHP